MILSRGRRYIFIHAPKTGGTSLALALEARAMADDIMLGDTPKAKKRRRRLAGVQTSGRLWKHAMLRDLYGLVSQEEMEAWFVFTLVRNPWDRMVSYYHWLRDQSFDHPAVALAGQRDFAGFIADPSTVAAMRRFPYAAYVSDRDGVEQADLFLRLEHLDEDIARLEDHLGFNLGEIPKANPSSREADYRGYYDAITRSIVAEACAEDIARFGYRFG